MQSILGIYTIMKDVASGPPDIRVSDICGSQLKARINHT